MGDDFQGSAARANEAVYNSGWTEKFVAGAPHLKHRSVRALFDRLLDEVYARAKARTAAPNFLDLGAGEGSVTVRLLTRGALVTAIDVSESQLAELRRKCALYRGQLTVHQGSIEDVLPQLDDTFDAAIASASLHHFADYLGVVREAIRHFSPHGQFVSFQDPLRYDDVSTFARTFDELSYLSWRIFQGDLWGGLRRRLLRRRGLHSECSLDNAEYHVLRSGVDQDAIAALLRGAGFDVDIFRYFSTQSGLFQPAGEKLGIVNTFAVVARMSSG